MATICYWPPHSEPAGSALLVRRIDHRRLAAQFQRHRDKVVARRLHYGSADLRTAREDQMIERKGSERRPLRGVALDHRDLLLWKHLGQQLRHQGAGGRRELGRLDHHPIAGGDCRRQRHGRQRERVVPWGHDPHYAERLVFDAGSAQQHGHRDVPARWTHEPTQVPLEIVDSHDQGQQFQDRSLMARSVAEIVADRLCNFVPAREDRAAEFLQVCTAACQGGHAVTLKGSVLLRQHPVETRGVIE